MTAPFQLLGGHPILDLVNTLDDRFIAGGSVELLPAYSDVLRFARQSRMLSTRQVAELKNYAGSRAGSRVLQNVHTLREAVAKLLYAVDPRAKSGREALKIIERLVIQARAHRELVFCGTAAKADGSAAWHWKFAEGRPELPLWMLSQSADELLTAPDVLAVGACQRDSCRWLFLDTSKNHTRRWCDMRVCGNRVKAQRFHAKHGGSRDT